MEQSAKKARTHQRDLEDRQEGAEVCSNTAGLKAGERVLAEGLTETTEIGDRLPKDGNSQLKRLSLSLKKIRPKLSHVTVTRSEGGSSCEAANEKEEILGPCASGELTGNGREQGRAAVPSPGPLAKTGSEEGLNAQSSLGDINVEVKASTSSSGEISEKWKDQQSLPVEVDLSVVGAGSSEAYYSANFKSAINTVLNNSPERHVISGAAVETVDRFMALPGQDYFNYGQIKTFPSIKFVLYVLEPRISSTD